MIDPYSNILSNDTFIYMVSKNINYPILIDKEFKIQTNAAIIKRSIDYCQWLEEGFDSTDKITRTRRYMKVWVKELINSSEFMDLRYYNPPHKLSFSDTYIYSDYLSIGNYKINSSIFENNKNNFVPFELDNNQSILLDDFNFSFKYMGNGQFYYFYNKSSNNFILPHKNNDDCTPGDIRVSISQFSPEIATIAGQFNSTTNEINTKNVDKLEIGAFESGNITMKKLLRIKYKRLINTTMIIRFIMFIGVILYIFLQSTSQIESIIKLFIASFAVLLSKNLIWKGKHVFAMYLSFCFVLFL